MACGISCTGIDGKRGTRQCTVAANLDDSHQQCVGMVRTTAWHVHGLPAIHLSKRDWSTKATLSSLHDTRLKVSSVILATLFMDVVVLESHNHL